MDDGNVVGIEFVVPRINDALDFLCDVVGLELVWRGRHRDAPAESAVVDAGTIAITLLQPDDHGSGMLADRRPRMTRLVFGRSEGGADGIDPHGDDLAGRFVDAGVPVRPMSAGLFVPPEVTTGILGIDLAMVFTTMTRSGREEPDDDG